MTKRVSLSDEAYEVLRRHKLGTESYSDAVLRLARKGGRLSEVIGLHPELVARRASHARCGRTAVGSTLGWTHHPEPDARRQHPSDGLTVVGY